ncbi:RCC1 domain-containing protein [Streptomyces sp. NPDC042898]|uniref:RCC1-like domain-containing protein n=1 Tax=Streptomyces sp. NPDC042898 TaxID=3154334 RepID=UPI0033EB439B
MTNGKVYAWGRGIHGQLGTGTRATSSVPRQAVGLENGQGGGPGGSRSGPSWRPPV